MKSLRLNGALLLGLLATCHLSLVTSALAQPTPTPSTASLTVNKSTGAIIGTAPTAALFASANGLQKTAAPINAIGKSTINSSGASLSALSVVPVLQLAGADSCGISSDSFGVNGTTNAPIFIGRSARGAPGSPSAIQTGDILSIYSGSGYGSTAYSSSRASIRLYAAENWTDTAQGTYIDTVVAIPGTISPILVTEAKSTGLAVLPTTASTSTTTGALTVAGGAGIAGSLYAASISSTGAITGATGGFSAPSGSIAITSTTGTNQVYVRYDNTGGTYYIGAENSTGSGFGATPYDMIAFAPTGKGISSLVGASLITRAAAGGLTVYGAMNATGLISGGGSTPASSSAPGQAGTITWDASYIYVCIATNTWKRVAISTW